MLLKNQVVKVNKAAPEVMEPEIEESSSDEEQVIVGRSGNVINNWRQEILSRNVQLAP